MVCANILVVKPAYRNRAFLLCIPKTGRSSAVPPSGHTGSHAPFIHPKHQLTKTGKTPPPTAQGAWGEGGRHPGPEHTVVDKQIFLKEQNGTGPIV
jgi:hypothetical protein